MQTPKAGARAAREVDSAAFARRLNHHGEDLASLRVRVLNMEAVLSQWPALRDFLRTLPTNLKALNARLVPFSAQCWSGKEGKPSRVEAAVAYLRAHPGASATPAALAQGLRPPTLRRSRLYRDLRLEQGHIVQPSNRHGPTGGTDRALRYLATHRPRSISEVARAVGVSCPSLSTTPRFRTAWKAYLRAAGRPTEPLRPLPPPAQ